MVINSGNPSLTFKNSGFEFKTPSLADCDSAHLRIAYWLTQAAQAALLGCNWKKCCKYANLAAAISSEVYENAAGFNQVLAQLRELDPALPASIQPIPEGK